VRNLEERIQIDQLKEALREIFEEYGTIIDLVAKKNLKAKGQAFIVFDGPEAAERAIKEVQGFELFEKPMMLDYAKTRSDAYVLKSGGDDDLEGHKRRRLAEKGTLTPSLFDMDGFKANKFLDRKQAQEALEAQKLKRPSQSTAEPSGRPAKTSRGAGLKSSNPTSTAVVPDEYLPPNKILFIQNLPDEYGVEGLTMIFERFEGFKEVRLVPGRKGISFVEYDTEAGAISAKESTAGMPLGEDERIVKVTYQRK
jgi:RNA recognition motif-containing protein